MWRGRSWISYLTLHTNKLQMAQKFNVKKNKTIKVLEGILGWGQSFYVCHENQKP